MLSAAKITRFWLQTLALVDTRLRISRETAINKALQCIAPYYELNHSVALSVAHKNVLP